MDRNPALRSDDNARTTSRRIPAVSAARESEVYEVREAVGVFDDAGAFERAVEALESAGFDRAGISVLGTHEEVRDRIGRHYRSIVEVADSSGAPHASYVSSGSIHEGEAAAIGVPFYVVGLASAAAVVASGGSLALAIGATVVGGGMAAGVGAVLARAIAHGHADRVRGQLERGGIVLWVTTPDDAAYERARKVLERSGAAHVHSHRVAGRWGLAARPLSDVQPDPLLGKGL